MNNELPSDMPSPSLLPHKPTFLKNTSWLERNLHRIIYILLYYMLSITTSIFNTYIISRDRYNFSFPLFLSGFSTLVQFFFASGSLWFLGVLQQTTSRITLGQVISIILPCAIASSLDIGISNSALKYVTLSFYIMVKSSSPIFVLLCAFALGLEKPTLPLLSIMGVIGSGVLMTVWSDTKFNVLGFLIVLSAAILSGIRWSLTQIIIEDSDQADDSHKFSHSGPLATILYLAPIGFTLLVGLSGVVEGFGTIFTSQHFSTLAETAKSFGIIGISGSLTFLLILSEYVVVHETSVLTFSVAGILKEIILIAISMLIFGDRLLFINYIGIIVSLSGIGSYNYLRYLKRKNQVSQDPKQVPVFPTSDYELIPPQGADPFTGLGLKQESFAAPEGLTSSNQIHSRSSSAIIASALEAQLTPSTIELFKRRLKKLIRPFAPHRFKYNESIK
jgi:solute carrier family 35, member C2